MNKAFWNLRALLGISLTWGILWTAVWASIGIIIAVVNPDSIDPGEGPMVFVAIFGPMGLFSGLVFGILLSFWERGRTIPDLPPGRAILWGILGSAIVQIGYLGHGDAGLAANIMMALLFSAIGGLITAAWLVMARIWVRRRRVAESLH